MKRNKFNLGHTQLVGFNMGDLIPLSSTEVLPGDTFQGGTTALIRMSPLVAPVMHPTHLTIHHWFVPWRLVWSGWEDFITGVSATPPPLQINSYANDYPITGWNSVWDYLGIQRQANGAPQPFQMNSMVSLAYTLIWNEFYRDEQVQAEALGVGAIHQVGWGKDRFTTARPLPQLGGSVDIPTAGASVTAESIRLAMGLLRLREARNRYGSRYTEYLRYLGVTPSDARLQRPEFLGGGKQTLQFSEVLQTSESGTTPLGTLGGHGIGAVRSNNYRRFFTEHGCVLTLAFVRPISIYANGCEAQYKKTIQQQYWQKEYEQLGMQPVPRSEVYLTGTNTNDTAVLGYQDIYDDYRHRQNRACTTFGYNDNVTVGSKAGPYWPWSFSRAFTTAVPPTLAGMIPCFPREDAFAEVASISSTHMQAMVQHHLIARRLVGRGGKSIIK